MVAEGMAQGIGASGRQTVLAVFVGGFGLDCYERNISDDLEKRIEVVWKAETATPYVGIGDFMRAAACCWGSTQPIATVGYGFQPAFQICCVPV